MSAESPPARRIFCGRDEVEEIVDWGPGRVVVRSARAPDREGTNEDAAALLRVDSGCIVVAVADGVGGRPGGESAADTALRRLADSVLRGRGQDTSTRTSILDGIESANAAILESGTGAATTLCLAEIDGDLLRPYHVGDSEILVVGQRGRLKLEIVAHSPVGYGVEAGLLDRDEALHHEERHFISNAVGTADMRIEVGSPMRLAPRDTVLLATDGLFDNLHVGEITEIVRRGPLPRAGAELFRRARERMQSPESQRPSSPSKPDDLTFVLYRARPPAAGR